MRDQGRSGLDRPTTGTDRAKRAASVRMKRVKTEPRRSSFDDSEEVGLSTFPYVPPAVSSGAFGSRTGSPPSFGVPDSGEMAKCPSPSLSQAKRDARAARDGGDARSDSNTPSLSQAKRDAREARDARPSSGPSQAQAASLALAEEVRGEAAAVRTMRKQNVQHGVGGSRRASERPARDVQRMRDPEGALARAVVPRVVGGGGDAVSVVAPAVVDPPGASGTELDRIELMVQQALNDQRPAYACSSTECASWADEDSSILGSHQGSHTGSNDGSNNGHHEQCFADEQGDCRRDGEGEGECVDDHGNGGHVDERDARDPSHLACSEGGDELASRYKRVRERELEIKERKAKLKMQQLDHYERVLRLQEKELANRERMVNNKSAFEEATVTFNVSGTIITVYRSTLRKCGSRFFAELLEASAPAPSALSAPSPHALESLGPSNPPLSAMYGAEGCGGTGGVGGEGGGDHGTAGGVFGHDGTSGSSTQANHRFLAEPVCLDEAGHVFVDRDPSYFRMIVTQLLKEREPLIEDLHFQCAGDEYSIQRLIAECTEMDLTDIAIGLRAKLAMKEDARTTAMPPSAPEVVAQRGSRKRSAAESDLAPEGHRASRSSRSRASHKTGTQRRRHVRSKATGKEGGTKRRMQTRSQHPRGRKNFYELID